MKKEGEANCQLPNHEKTEVKKGMKGNFSLSLSLLLRFHAFPDIKMF
jgi:hypothetical protein